MQCVTASLFYGIPLVDGVEFIWAGYSDFEDFAYQNLGGPESPMMTNPIPTAEQWTAFWAEAKEFWDNVVGANIGHGGYDEADQISYYMYIPSSVVANSIEPGDGYDSYTDVSAALTNIPAGGLVQWNVSIAVLHQNLGLQYDPTKIKWYLTQSAW